jgi:hypothetical protein
VRTWHRWVLFEHSATPATEYTCRSSSTDAPSSAADPINILRTPRDCHQTHPNVLSCCLEHNSNSHIPPQPPCMAYFVVEVDRDTADLQIFQCHLESPVAAVCTQQNVPTAVQNTPNSSSCRGACGRGRPRQSRPTDWVMLDFTFLNHHWNTLNSCCLNTHSQLPMLPPYATVTTVRYR